MLCVFNLLKDYTCKSKRFPNTALLRSAWVQRMFTSAIGSQSNANQVLTLTCDVTCLLRSKLCSFLVCICFSHVLLSVFPRIVTGNTIVRLTMVTPRLKENAFCSFQQIYPTILQATKSRWNLSRNSVFWVWSNMLETVQFDRQNRHSTIFCNSAVSKQNFPFRSFFFSNSFCNFRESFEKCILSLRQHLFQFSSKFYLKNFF